MARALQRAPRRLLIRRCRAAEKRSTRGDVAESAVARGHSAFEDGSSSKAEERTACQLE